MHRTHQTRKAEPPVEASARRATPLRYILGAIAIFFAVAFGLIALTAWMFIHPHLR